jgi:histone-lysine N-methyltransferase SUV39H
MNACYVNESNLDKPLLALFTRRDVLPWEELSFSYTGYDSDEEVRDLLCCMLWLSLILL